MKLYKQIVKVIMVFWKGFFLALELSFDENSRSRCFVLCFGGLFFCLFVCLLLL